MSYRNFIKSIAYLKVIVYYCIQKLNNKKMTIVVNNTEANKAKKIMNLLMNCINDKSISKIEKAQYYKEYIEVSSNYLKLLSNA